MKPRKGTYVWAGATVNSFTGSVFPLRHFDLYPKTLLLRGLSPPVFPE